MKESPKNNFSEEGFLKKDVLREKSEQLELPVRVSSTNGRYFLSFVSQEAAEKFVMAFWGQVDIVRKTPEDDRAMDYFKSGMWRPDQDIGSTCRTGLMHPTTAEQKEGGVTTMVYINGNTGALQPWGVEALKNLVALEK